MIEADEKDKVMGRQAADVKTTRTRKDRKRTKARPGTTRMARLRSRLMKKDVRIPMARRLTSYDERAGQKLGQARYEGQDKDKV